MTDKTLRVFLDTDQGAVNKKLKDMGDGTFAEVVQAAGITASIEISNDSGNALPVTDANLGAAADAAATTDSGTFSLIALLKRLLGKLPSNGDIASGAADSGNPLKAGAKYNATLPTFTDGQRSDLQANAKGALIVQLAGTGGVATRVAGNTNADGVAAASDSAMVQAQAFGYNFNGASWDRQSKATNVARLLNAAGSTNSNLVKNAAGTVHKIRGYNAKAGFVYLKLYNKTTAPTVGTDTPVATFTLPASAAFEIDLGPLGLYFATGIGYGISGAAADNDTTALTAGDVTGLNVIYS